MTTTIAPPPRAAAPEPLAAFARDVLRRAALLGDDPAQELDAAQVEEALDLLSAVESLALTLKAHVVGRAETLGLPRASGTRSTARWLSVRARTSMKEAQQHRRLSEVVARHPHLAGALRTGAVHPEQALAAARALATLEVTSDVLDRVERLMVVQAATCDAKALVAGLPDVLATVDPEVAAEVAAARVAATAEAASVRTNRSKRLSMWDDGAGQTHGRFTLPTPQAAVLRTILTALAGADGEAGPLGPERLGQAFADLVERHPVRPMAGASRVPRRPRGAAGRAGQLLEAVDRFRNGGPPGPVPA